MNHNELRLSDVELREIVELVRIDLPHDQAESLLERGVVPGCSVCPIRCSPAGDPILQIDGTVLAMRRETACCLYVRRVAAAAA
ncbi:MAG: FeoA family protein [Longimicrobiales bacterium]